MNAEHRDSVMLPAANAVIGLAPPIEASATEATNHQGHQSPRTAAVPQLPAPYGEGTTSTASAPASAPEPSSTPTGPTRTTSGTARAPHPARTGNPARTTEFLDGLEALVEQARSGHPRAMTELIRRFTPLVRAVVRRAGIYGVEAEDVEQETWLRLATNLDRVREPAALPRWLSVTAGRLCTSLFDKRRRVQPAGDFSEDVWLSNERWSDPADVVCLRDEVVRLYDAIDTLAPRDRTLVKLLMDATPYREISATIAMPVGSIGPTRERVLRKLAGSASLRPAPAAPKEAVPVAVGSAA